MNSGLIPLSCWLLTLPSPPAPPDLSESDMLARLPAVCGSLYHCQDMVLTVNKLRHLGKRKALAALLKALGIDARS